MGYHAETSVTAVKITERFDMSKPASSKQLKVLKHAGLVDDEKKGQFVHYSIADDNLTAKSHNVLATFCFKGSQLKKESKVKVKAILNNE